MHPFNMLREDIDNIQRKSPLAAPFVTLLGASKSQNSTTIVEAIRAGLTVFGENKVQEAEEKWPALLKQYPHIALHLIGPLQSNKTRQALSLFDVIQTLDRPSLADAIARIYTDQWRCKAFYIQVNTGEEPQKAGISPKEAPDFIRYCQKLGLPVTGLMCVPPADAHPAPHFALLKKLADEHGLKQLSMGMSDDYKTAIRMGSSFVRIGRALFGERA